MSRVLYLARFNDRFISKTGDEGIRGLLEVSGEEFHTLERGRDKVTGQPYKLLPPGPYHLEMAYWTNRHGDKGKAIRVLGEYSNNRIYIHPANFPNQLSGCIAPGVVELDGRGVGRSREAMERIFEILGGWEENRRVGRLEVR